MTHRGPDDYGIYYKPKEGIALGHRRLSIIDLSKAGRQPFISNDGRYTVVFNGEIYNYLDLKKELNGKYDFKTKTDTEVLLAAYSVWGKESLKKFNGMFAFAIWDAKKRVLFCARDRLGIKPLYYTIHRGTIYFASEIKGILKASGITPTLNKQSFLDYLSYRHVLGEDTLFEGIYTLLPGHYFVAQSGKKLRTTSSCIKKTRTRRGRSA
jgi:asparagine synthase (glutamine-hydrolysing)